MDDSRIREPLTLLRRASLNFDAHEPLTAELSIKIQPSVLEALHARFRERRDGGHDFSRHVREMILEWLVTDGDCYDCVFVKDVVARR